MLGYSVEITKYEGADDLRRSALYTPIDNTDIPFVFASAMRGLKTCSLPVNRPADGRASYKVRLGFSAPRGDRPGQRVFDVKLDGKIVLANFDIVKESGAPDRAVWKEFTAQVGEKLTWDPETERFAGSDEANELIAKPIHEPRRA